MPSCVYIGGSICNTAPFCIQPQRQGDDAVALDTTYAVLVEIEISVGSSRDK